MRTRSQKLAVSLAFTGLLAVVGASTSFAGVLPDVGVDYGPPLGLSVYGDVAFGDMDEGGRWFPLVGGQFGFGRGGTVATGVAHQLGHGIVFGALRGTATFTGGSALHALPRSTYAGLRVEVGAPWLARVHAGVETRIGSGRRDTRLTWGVSVSPVGLFALIRLATIDGPFPGC